MRWLFWRYLPNMPKIPVMLIAEDAGVDLSTTSLSGHNTEELLSDGEILGYSDRPHFTAVLLRAVLQCTGTHNAGIIASAGKLVETGADAAVAGKLEATPLRCAMDEEDLTLVQ